MNILKSEIIKYILLVLISVFLLFLYQTSKSYPNFRLNSAIYRINILKVYHASDIDYKFDSVKEFDKFDKKVQYSYRSNELWFIFRSRNKDNFKLRLNQIYKDRRDLN